MKDIRKFKRMCSICREYKEKEDLIRITKDYKTGELKINTENIFHGRSVYVCKNQECIKKFTKNKKSLYALKSEMCENIRDFLDTVLKK